MIALRTLSSLAVCGLLACGGGAQTGTSTGPGPATTGGTLTTKDLVNQSKPSIVAIQTVFPDGRKAAGTGFFITADGRIATNLHVVHGAAQVKVKLLDGSVHDVKTMHATDRERDLAIVGISSAGKRPTLALADSDQVSAGEKVIAIGNPLGILEYTVSDGLISSVRKVNPSLTILQISAPISQGSSGGPLFNDKGKVIGVATMIATRGQNLNFGVPSNYLRALMSQAKSMPFDEYVKRSAAELAKRLAKRRGPTVKRKIPNHTATIFASCTDTSINEVYKAIGEAIELGAPLYNKGNQCSGACRDRYYKACYKIYEGTALRFQSGASCKGLRSALGDGLLRAKTLKDWKAKAWAMRDAFDGIIRAVVLRARKAGATP